MKHPRLLIACLLFHHTLSCGFAQEPSAAGQGGVPEAPLKVKAVQVIRGGGENGGDLEIRRVEPAVITVVDKVVSLPKILPADPAALAKLAALKASAPTEIRLFTPRVTLHTDGQSGKTLSLIQWWVTINGEYQEYEAWSVQDLSDIQAVGDLTVNRRRWLLMPGMVVSSGKSLPQPTPPAATAFAGPQSFILTRGEAGNEAALEPLKALLAEHDTNAAAIATAFAAMRKSQEEAEALAKLPKPPVNTVIQYYTTDADAVQGGSVSK